MVNAGRILIIAQGEWSNLTNYEQLDLVTRGDIAYLGRRASVGVDPATDSQMTYWQPFGSAAKIADTQTPGLVMPDGTTITINSAGLIKANLGVSDLTDVVITNVADGSVLRYDSSTQKWKNIVLGSAAYKSSTDAVTEGSTALLESGGAFTAISQKRNKPTILTSTLAIGATSLSFTNAAIGNSSRIRVTTNPFSKGLEDAVQSGTTVTLTFAAQEVALSVSLEIQND